MPSGEGLTRRRLRDGSVRAAGKADIFHSSLSISPLLMEGDSFKASRCLKTGMKHEDEAVHADKEQKGNQLFVSPHRETSPGVVSVIQISKSAMTKT